MTSETPEQGPETHERDRSFCPYRTPRTEGARRLVAETASMVEKYETVHGLRQRRRKARDHSAFLASVSAVVCDLAHHALAADRPAIAITRSRAKLATRSRYRPASMGKALLGVMDALAAPELALAHLTIGKHGRFGKSRRSTIVATERLKQRVGAAGVTLEDFGRTAGEETIILRNKPSGPRERGDLLEYSDIPLTTSARRDVALINEWLAGADVSFDEWAAPQGTVVDEQARFLRRCFTRGDLTFKTGGRLFGGFWQDLTKEQRRAGISIEGESIVALDYGQVGPRILYAMTGAAPPQGDLYGVPGFEHHRAGIKRVLNAMVFAEQVLERFPEGTGKLFLARTGFAPVREAIVRHHAPISHHFASGAGHAVMYEESELLVAVLLRCREEGIVALPVHDCLLVKAGASSTAERIMTELSRSRFGAAIPVTREAAVAA